MITLPTMRGCSFVTISRLYSRAVLDVVHLAFAIWGIFAWREPKDTRPSV